MKKGYFIISEINFIFDENNSVGVHKKINNQFQAFRKSGFDCDLINLNPEKTNLIKRFFDCFRSNVYKNIEIDNCDFIYVRRIIPNNKSFICLLKRIKERNPDVKIIYELPTYPYDSEHTSLKQKVILFVDKIYRKKLHNYVDLMTTYSYDKEIFGVKALTIKNGINVSKIPVVENNNFNSKEITLIAVAQFALWHGFDRLIEGLKNYYSNNHETKVNILFVGNGKCLEEYKVLVSNYKLDNYVFFLGMLNGQKLTDAFNNADIGICSLGCHRMNIFLSSVLKSREYLSRGLPIVTSTKIDIVPEDFKYCLSFPEDESPIDIEKIVDFYLELVKNESVSDIHKNIRQFAEQTCDMTKVMKPVFDFIEQN